MRLEPFEPGAWCEHQDKRCPQCGAVTWFAMDKKKFGTHQLRVCKPCGGVYLDGDLVESLSEAPPDDAA